VKPPAHDQLTVAALLRDAGLARRVLPQALADAHAQDDEQAASAARALAEAASGHAELALAALGPANRLPVNRDAVLLHGLLALEAGRFDEALADFEWLRDRGGKVLAPAQGLVRYWRALALDRAGRGAEARQAYGDFLDFWKTADDDLPIMVEARRALVRLGS